jgi:Tfp pilus assembly protein PilV
MPVRLRNEDGFLLVELLTATVVISIALLALLGAYDQAWSSLHSGAKDSSAGIIANNQLELYASLQYSSIGLDATTLSSTKSSDSTYTTDEAALSGTGTDVTISGCGSSAQCLPVQTIKGADGHNYKLETFIRSVANPSAATWNEKVVTVIVRDLSATGNPKVVTLQTAFDPGPSS